MPKRTSYAVHAGQLEGAKLKIAAVHNDGLKESVTLVNQGRVAQPMAGWVLASLRGQVFYSFPDDLTLPREMSIVIHSGQQEPKNTAVSTDFFWTTDQIWNNRGDIAILFDANGLEIDRHSYPHERVMGSSGNRRKVLIRNNDGFEITDEAPRRAKKVPREQSNALTGQP